MKAGIYRCPNGHLRIYTAEEAAAKAGLSGDAFPVVIPKCPVLAVDGSGSSCSEDVKLFGTFEVEHPLGGR